MSTNKDTMQQLIYKVQKGDKDAKELIRNHYKNYIIKIIEEKYSDTNLNKDKLFEAGMDAVNCSISKYNNFSSKFYIYITANIRCRLISEARSQQNLRTRNNQINFYTSKILQDDNLAKEKIAKHYINQINRLIENEYNDKNYDKEELQQAGYLGLAYALKNYNKYKKRHIYYSINYFVKQYILAEIKKQKQKMNMPIKNSYIDFITDIENLELIKIAINKLKDNHKNIVILHLYYNYTFQEIGDMYNLTRARIQFIYKESLEKIKAEIKREIKRK